MKNQKNKPEPINPYLLLSSEDIVSIEYLKWHWRCDRSMAQEIYKSEGKSLKNYIIDKDVWDSLKDEFGDEFDDEC